MKNLLVITYNFPPIGGSGALRIVKHVKYLPMFGWNPIVLTIQKDANNIEDADASFLEELSEKVVIYRSRIIEPYDIYRFFGGRQKQFSRGASILHIDRADEKNPNFIEKLKKTALSFLIPDAKIGWYPGAIRKARQIFKNHKIDAIYSSSPKNTTHVIARYLSRKYKRPWVADFRDPWPNYYSLNRPSFLKKIEESLERSVLSKATKTTFAWPGILTDITARHKDFDERKAVLISNGFDGADFKGVIPKKFEHFTISYAGIFYKKRNPESLFKGLKLLFKEEPELRRDIRILFIGISDSLLTDLIYKYEVSDVVKHINYVTYRECIGYLLGSHLLFLNTLGNCVPGKLYEYLGLRKPILALVSHKTTVAKIINKTQAGVVIDPMETEKIKDIIKEMYEKYKKGSLKLDRKNDSVIYQYERERLTGKLAGILNEIS